MIDLVTQFDWRAITANLPYMAEGMALSLLIVLVATLGGLVFGLGLALLRTRPGPFAIAAASYVAVMRSLPLILVLFWFYFLLPLALGRPVGNLACALVAFVLFEAAFYCEIIRAGIAAVSPGQGQAALATGMRPGQALWLVELPQALRLMVPVLLNQVILVFQDTSLVYVVTLHDFLTSASLVAFRDGRQTEIFCFVALVYLVLCLGGTALVRMGQRSPA